MWQLTLTRGHFLRKSFPSALHMSVRRVVRGPVFDSGRDFRRTSISQQVSSTPRSEWMGSVCRRQRNHNNNTHFSIQQCLWRACREPLHAPVVVATGNQHTVNRKVGCSMLRRVACGCCFNLRSRPCSTVQYNSCEFRIHCAKRIAL